MEVVFFGEELAKRAPNVGVLLAVEDVPCEAKWVELPTVIQALMAGTTITLRPATETEMRRAEKAAALYELEAKLGSVIQGILNQAAQHEMMAAITGIREALESAFPIGPGTLLDSKES